MIMGCKLMVNAELYKRAGVSKSQAGGGVVIAPLISGTERSGRTGSSICGTQCKRTVPCLKCIKNFKEVIAEPATRSGES